MDWDEYFRQQATMYRKLAEKTEDAFIKQELLDLAAVCEEVANNIEDRRPTRASHYGLPLAARHQQVEQDRASVFSFITINWRGKPLRSYRTIVQLIAATTTDAGLRVRAELDENKYPKGVKVSDAQPAAVNLSRHSFHGDWNYTIAPGRQNTRQKPIV